MAGIEAVMPIEFRCPQCRRLLRTEEGTEGKRAQCPECGLIVTVPQPGAMGTGPAFPPEPPGGESPGVSPADQAAPSAAVYGPTPWAIRPTLIEVGDVFRRTWAIFTDRMGISAGVILVSVLLGVAVDLALGSTEEVATRALQDRAASVLIKLLVWFVAFLFNLWIGIGVAICFLRIARGQKVHLEEIFAGGPYFLTVLLAGILVGLIVGGVLLVCLIVAGILTAILPVQPADPKTLSKLVALGTGLLAIVPVIVLGLTFSQYRYLIIDRDAGITQSLGLSREITRGNKLAMFLLLAAPILVAGLVLLGMWCVPAPVVRPSLFLWMARFFVVLLVLPYLAVLWAVMYLAMTGQPTAEARQADPMRV